MIPPGEPQVEVYDGDGTFVARVDLLWTDSATVGEADGAAKYSLGDWSDLATASADELVEARVEAGLRVVRSEKAREDALRSLGLEIARWTTAEILHRLPEVARPGPGCAGARQPGPLHRPASLDSASVTGPGVLVEMPISGPHRAAKSALGEQSSTRRAARVGGG